MGRGERRSNRRGRPGLSVRRVTGQSTTSPSCRRSTTSSWTRWCAPSGTRVRFCSATTSRRRSSRRSSPRSTTCPGAPGSVDAEEVSRIVGLMALSRRSPRGPLTGRSSLRTLRLRRTWRSMCNVLAGLVSFRAFAFVPTARPRRCNAARQDPMLSGDLPRHPTREQERLACYDRLFGAPEGALIEQTPNPPRSPWPEPTPVLPPRSALGAERGAETGHLPRLAVQARLHPRGVPLESAPTNARRARAKVTRCSIRSTSATPRPSSRSA